MDRSYVGHCFSSVCKPLFIIVHRTRVTHREVKSAGILSKDTRQFSYDSISRVTESLHENAPPKRATIHSERGKLQRIVESKLHRLDDTGRTIIVSIVRN